MLIISAFIPPHRCYVPACDTDNSSYAQEFINFTIPWETDGQQFRNCFKPVSLHNQTNNDIFLHKLAHLRPLANSCLQFVLDVPLQAAHHE